MSEHAVAVVGMAVRVPGADTLDDLWRLLLTGRVALPAGHDDDSDGGGGGNGDGRARRVGQVARIAEFDADLFRMSPLQARIADPQHRALLEVSWLALEDAAVDPSRGDDVIGLIVGCGPPGYERENVASEPDLLTAAGPQQVALLNDRDFLSSMLSYRLGLSGASITVQTACSTSLVAVHLAARSLLSYESDVVLAGAATVQGRDTYEYRSGDILSADGRCRPFTQDSPGTVPASGAVVVVLKRLADARAAGDRIRAVILGSAVTNDGPHRLSEAAPSPDGHERAIRDALAVAGITADSVAYVQTHGTGTALGDEVELAALRSTYGRGGRFPAALGAVKANLGHTDTAAGAVGLVAAVLALEHATIPPVPAQPGDGPALDLGGRLMLPREPVPFPSIGASRAAVSSLGLGGTNAHVVLEAAPVPTSRGARWAAPMVAPVSAATPAAVGELAAAVADRLPGTGLADVCGTLWHRRRALPVRVAPVLTAPDEGAARDQLARALRRVADLGVAGHRTGTAVALLPGQGDGVTGAAEELARHHAGFRRHYDELVELIRSVGGPDLTTVRAAVAAGARIVDTAVVQPWLHAVELALLRALRDAGVEFAALAGHSIGELTAAAYAGVFGAEDAARAVVERGRLMSAMPGGAMVAVDLDEAGALAVSAGLDVDVAVVNEERAIVLAGTEQAVAAVEARVTAAGGRAKRLAVSHAFHSRMMEPAAEQFAQVLATLPLSPARVPVFSNVTGAQLTDDQATSPRYWAEHIRRTVRFHACVDAALDLSPAFVVIAGPGNALAATARRAVGRRGSSTEVLSALGADSAGEPASYLRTLARMWERGCDVELPVPRPGRVVDLPPYPLARTRYWAGPGGPEAGSGGSAGEAVIPADHAGTAATGEDGTPGHGDETVAMLADLWRRSFGRDAITPGDNFFELGGSSLQAVQLVNVVADTLVVDVGLNDLYECSTFGDFAGRVMELVEERDRSPEFAALLAAAESGEIA